jgi:cytochrome oxidase Cu insertion factor (SCO1/SenC/PrrC family)
MKPSPRLMIILVLAALLSTASVWAQLPKGTIAPNFSLKDLSGAVITLSNLRGRVVVVEFFATW